MAITTNSSGLASPGIGSGLDVNAIVDKLMAVESRPLTLIANEQTTYKAKISAYGMFKSALAALDTALNGLTNATAFRARSAVVSDSSVASASAAAGAATGSYSVEVTALAQAQKLVSSGFATLADTVGTGTLTFAFGNTNGGVFTADPDQGTKTVTISAGQNSLAGIRDAVNAANIGVTATIVNDGSANGQRLVFTASTSGANHSMKITVADSDGTPLDAAGLSQLAYDPAGSAGAGKNLTQKTAAQDAALLIDGIAVIRSTNVISDAIAGVTLTVAKTNVAAPATLTVNQDASAAASAVQQFVTAFNSIQTTIASLTKYDTDKKQASVLTGDGVVRTVQAQLRALLSGSILGGSAGGPGSLAEIGIKADSAGALTFDSTKLTDAMKADPAGVERLFAAVAKGTDALVSVTATGIKVTPGDYALNVTRLATRGTLVANAAAGLTITAGVNDTLEVTIDGVAATVTLAAGTYASAGALASEAAGKINGASAIKAAGGSVAITENAGVLTFTSARYGSTSSVALAGNAAASLVGGAPTATAGLNVAGTAGDIALNGSGQVLSGASGTALEGLSVTVTGGSTGARGTVSYSEGVGVRLNRLLDQVLASDGAVTTKTEGVQKSLSASEKRAAAIEARLELVKAAYLRQFQALDTKLASLQATSSYLTQQLASLSKSSGNGGNS